VEHYKPNTSPDKTLTVNGTLEHYKPNTSPDKTLTGVTVEHYKPNTSPDKTLTVNGTLAVPVLRFRLCDKIQQRVKLNCLYNTHTEFDGVIREKNDKLRQHLYTVSGSQTDRQTYNRTDRQTDRQTDTGQTDLTRRHTL